MSLTLTEMRDLLRRGLGGLDSQELPDDDADLYLNMALWELDNRFTFEEKETVANITLSDGVREYTIPSATDAIQGVYVLDDQRTYKVDQMTEDFFQQVRSDKSSARARPDRYLRRDEILVLHPVPDDSYTLNVLLWKTVESLVNSTDSPDLPRNWHELVVENAIARGHFYNQDYNLAQQAQSLTIGKERAAVEDKSKEERDMSHAGLDVLREAPDGRK